LKSEKVAKTPLPPKGVSLQPIAGPDGNILVFSEDGREFTARFVGLDGWTGLSLLQIEGLQQTPLPEADAYKLALEQSVGLIAPTLAQPGPGVTGKLALKLDKIKGRLKTLERNSTGEIKQMTFITENAENISPAFVGGIVVNDANEAIGMIQTVMLKEAKVIPIADIKEAVARVQLQAALAPRPWLGARGEAITASSLQQLLLTGWGKEQAQNLLTQRRGVLLTSIPPETPAALARLKVGDVVLGINQNQVANADEFTRLLTQSETGQDLLFTVIRPNSATEQNFKVKLGETPDPMLAMLRAEYRALRLRSKDLFERLGMDTLQLDPNPFDKRRPFKHGHYVSYVYPDSAAAKAGLQAGDVIEAINGKRLYGPFVWQITREPKEITLTIVRSEQKLTIKINPNEEEKR
jgi:serine protease Do